MSIEVTHVLAWIIFLVSYAVFAFGRLPGTRLDRSSIAVLGAVAMFLIGALDRHSAVAALDFPTLILLAAMMVVVAVLHLDGFFEWITGHIVARLNPRHLLPGVIFSSGILSAFLVNDVVCLFMAPLILRVSRQMGRDPLPLLLGLATASNIGSVATITGNPQNILIGSVSHIGYRDFLLHLGPVAIVGLLLNWAVIAVLCRARLVAEEPAQPATAVQDKDTRLLVPVIILGGIVAGFLFGFAPALVAASGAAFLMLIRARRLRTILAEIDWSLLFLFVGLFLILGAAEQTGIAGTLLNVAERWNLHHLAVFAVVVTFLSNLVSNVPAVMLLKGMASQFAHVHQFWLALAMVSTLAGNLTITGSIANIIVVELVRPEVRITFKDYVRVGLPTTILSVAFGTAWIALFCR